MPDKVALSVDNLHKQFADHHAVNGISFHINTGECVGILGPNGAGKSTTLQICLGTSRANSGTVNLLGYSLPQEGLAARRRIGVVPQSDNLDPDFSCAENLIVYGRYFGLKKEAIEWEKLLEFAGLETRAHERITALSGGMQRRLALARALVNDPDFIFLDEPTTGLDPQARHLIWERLRRLQADNKTLLLTTHFMEEAERLCDRVYIMDDGRIIAEGKPAQLVRERVEREVVEMYGDESDHWLQKNTALYQRREHFGQLTYCYCDNAAALVAALQNADFQYTLRPTNLEDVFLTLTGRDLRE